MPSINGKRLIADLRRLSEFGRYKTGVHRPTYSQEDMEARHWLCDRMAEAGLDATLDGIGTVIGRSRISGPRMLVGSHLETQPYAGWLDGAMGVIYGLELARAFAESPASKGLAIDVGAWADEEGHYGAMLGSRSFCGTVTEKMLDEATNKTTGKSLRAALAEAQLAGRSRELLKPQDYVGYLEAHVEQGDYLESCDLRLGIVTGIVGIYTYRITCHGQQNHAGTTRMAIRKDAGVALLRLWQVLDSRFPTIVGPKSVWTTGKITFDPGAPSVIPGKAEMLFQFRDIELNRLELLERTVKELIVAADAAGPCRVEIDALTRTQPHAMSPKFQDELERAAEMHAPDRHVRMPSAAGHDAQIFATRLPAGMLFVPSIAGISHHYEEDTKEEDIVLGCQVFADAAESILRTAT
jgi:N-carbamoyl-L-amino-acid hydrolase